MNMPKIYLYILTSLLFMQLHATEKLYIYRNDGSLNGFESGKIDSLNFDSAQTVLKVNQIGGDTKSILLSSIDSMIVVDEPTIAYKTPTYADDYSSISSYSYRQFWHMANVHDPTVEKQGDYYYMSQTDASYGNVLNGYGHYPIRRSKDLVSWEFRGFGMPNTPPSWIKDTLNAMRARVGLSAINSPSYGFWAPVIRKVGNKFRMYYSVIVDNYIRTGASNTAANFDNSWTERAFIGMRETDDMSLNYWEDKGYVISSSTDRGINWYRSSLSNWSAYFKWNAIDPTYTVTPEGDHWLTYGSWHSGIVTVQIDSVTGKPLNSLKYLADYGTRVARRVNNDNNRWQAQEGSEVIYNPETGYYYMFLSYDELSVNYNTRVCRSRNIKGPFKGYDGTDISLGGECWPIISHPYKFNNHPGWVGFSHCAVFQNPDNKQWFYVSQARLPANTNGNPYSNAIMMGHIRKIEWTEDGWPVILPERYGNVPQKPITDEDLAGNWELIVLNYQAGVQQTSVSLALNSNNFATGYYLGPWSYDHASHTLTIKATGKGTIKLKVARELDWEASPRVQTLVFTGLNSSGRSLWGKKL